MKTKNTYINVLFLSTILLTFSFCTKSNLEIALEKAGDNRPELEKVLKHYSINKGDSLKLKAAKFLIENMDVHFFITSPELKDYYKTLDSIFSINSWNDNITEEQEILLSQIRKPNPDSFKLVPDIEYVSANFLIDNIDKSFEAWKLPFAKDLDFNNFCELLLPYKSGALDCPDFWHSEFKNTYYPYVKYSLDTGCNLDSGIVLHHKSYLLDGKEYFSIPDSIFDTIPEFTISCMATPLDNKPWARVFDFGKSSNCYVCFIPYTDEGKFRFEIVTDKSWDIIQSDSLPSMQPIHIAITFSQEYMAFYIDGILKKKMKTYISNNDLKTNYIGRSHYNSDLYFKGEIRDFRVYNRELNYTEVNALSGKESMPEKRQQLLSILQVLRSLTHTNITLGSFVPGGSRPDQLIKLKKGSCSDYSVKGTYIFRSLGIPSGVDFIPQWASRSLGHDWNALYTGHERMEDYSFGTWWDTIGYHIQTREEKISKVFRHTYAKQINTPAIQEKDEYLPPFFKDPCLKDVTDSYLDCIDIAIPLKQIHSDKRQYVYLSTFNNRDWVPIHWGKIDKKKAVFTKMGKDIVYLPVYYDRGRIFPAAPPFILTKEGNIEKLIPDVTKTQTLTLFRKYKPGNVPQKGELLVGGRFQVSNKKDFSDSLTVYVVNDIPEIRYNPIEVALNKSYRYFRFLAPEGSGGGEISEIEIYSNEGGSKLSGKITGNLKTPKGWEAENVFDGDPLTSYQCEYGERGWVGLDFGKSFNIDYFRFLPRNDDNFIKEGEEYELFYWNNNYWTSLGKQTGTSKQYLEYPNAPSNALFWLRNNTKGKEERIFTYENNTQVWW